MTEKEKAGIQQQLEGKGKSALIVSGIKKDNFFKGLWEIFTTLEKYHRWGFVLVFAISGLCYYCIDNYFAYCDKVIDECISYCPTLIAFCIAAYVFLLQINEETKERLLATDERNIPVVSTFVAMLIWFTLILCLDLFLSILSELVGYNKVVMILLYGTILYTICMFLDILVYLYGFHTFVYPKYEIHTVSQQHTSKEEHRP